MDEQVSQNIFKSTTPLEDGGGDHQEVVMAIAQVGDFINVVIGGEWWRSGRCTWVYCWIEEVGRKWEGA
jgi:hypothetical protein